MSLKEARLSKGLTQEDLLRKIDNISLSTLRRIEKGLTSCNLDTARQISIALDMSIEEIFFKNEEVEEVKEENKPKNRLLSQ